MILVSFIEFLTTMPNFMYAPNITDAQNDLGTSDSTLATFSLTIYILGFGLGPLLFAPLSELYGRTVVYRCTVAAFLVMTMGCGLSHNIEMLVAFRFLAGSFGAAPVAIGGAVVGDLFPVKERGTAMSIYQGMYSRSSINIERPGLIFAPSWSNHLSGGWPAHWRIRWYLSSLEMGFLDRVHFGRLQTSVASVST